MLSPCRRLAAVVRLTLATLAALMIATPASAQFGGLKKKIKPAAQPAKNTEGAAPTDQGSMIALTKDVVNQLITGLKAGQVERKAASEAGTRLRATHLLGADRAPHGQHEMIEQRPLL